MIKKDLELLPSDKDCAFSLMLPLVLLPTEVYAVTLEGYYKGNTVGALGPGGGKVILTLLAEVITFHVEIIITDVR